MSYNLQDILKQVKENEAYLVDVREKDEWELGYIKGACLLSLSEIQAKKGINLPLPDKPLYLYCRSGNRSYLARDILLPTYPHAVALDEGFNDLEKLSLPVSYPQN